MISRGVCLISFVQPTSLVDELHTDLRFEGDRMTEVSWCQATRHTSIMVCGRLHHTFMKRENEARHMHGNVDSTVRPGIHALNNSTPPGPVDITIHSLTSSPIQHLRRTTKGSARVRVVLLD